MKVKFLCCENEQLITDHINDITLLRVDEDINPSYKYYYYEADVSCVTDIRVINEYGNVMTPKTHIDKGDFMLIMTWKMSKL